MGKKKKLFEQLRKNMYDRRASSVLEYGNESLYNEYISAQKALDTAEDMYDRIADSYDRSEDRREELEERIGDLDSKRDEMIGGIKILGLRLPLLSSLLYTKWLQTGITKKGREFNKLERSISRSERTLSRMNRKGTRMWEEILAAEQGIENAEKRLSNVEKEIREFNKSAKAGKEKSLILENTTGDIKQEKRAEKPKLKEVVKAPFANLFLKYHINRDQLQNALEKTKKEENAMSPEDLAYTLGRIYDRDISDDGIKTEYYISKGLSLIEQYSKGEEIPRISNIIEQISNGVSVKDIKGNYNSKDIRIAKQLCDLFMANSEIVNSDKVTTVQFGNKSQENENVV